MHILIYRLGSLGDTVVALPAFRLIRQTYPDARITVLTNAPVSDKAAPLESVLENTGLINAAIHYPVGLRDPAQLATLRAKLLAEHFDLAVSLTAARGLAASLRDWLFLRTLSSKVIGIPFARRDLVCQPVGGGLYESEAERLLRRVGKLGTVDLHDPKWRDLALSPDEISTAARLLTDAGIPDDFLAVSLGAKSPLKDWGTENWRDLFIQIGRDLPAIGLVLFGSADEFSRNETLLPSWRWQCLNLCGKTSPRVSAAVLGRARLYLGHDSGPMHLAAASGTRCVSIFSAQSPPGQWFPFGEGHVNLYPQGFYDPMRAADLDYQRRAIATIGIAEAAAAVTSCLS
ncbi:MAG: glycosyltransferase family 9 protein [Methylacidiphilales bacterium]|nr:glycosyltransferase family 9 protein [Candidatus Methylacidiphilales bacterium]